MWFLLGGSDIWVDCQRGLFKHNERLFSVIVYVKALSQEQKNRRNRRKAGQRDKRKILKVHGICL